MRSLTYTGAAALLGAVSFTALASAADLPIRTAPPAFVTPILVSGWDGFYAGSTYGYGFNEFRTSANGTSRSKDESGQSGGGLVGYNFQTGHFVYGVEAGIDLNVIRGTIGARNTLPASRVDSLDDIRFRGRLGYEFGWFMPFVAGGAVLNETYQSSPGPAHDFGDVQRSVGYTIGAGVDFKLNPHNIISFLPESLFGPLILRLEYLHDGLPRETYTIGPVGGRQAFRTEADNNLIRAAVIYRFGDTAPRPYADAAGDVNWGGGYGGLLGGYGSADVRSRGGPVRGKLSGDGPLGGLYAGSNFMFFNNRVMLGFDGSTSWSDFTGNGTDASGNRGSYREYVRADLRARAGYAFGNFLPFVAAGVTFARSEQRDQVTLSEQGRIATDNFTIGGGLDYRITQRISLRGEYLYETNLNNKSVTLNGISAKQDRDANVVRFGAAYHFE